MLAEFVKSIRDMCQDAVKPVTFDVPGRQKIVVVGGQHVVYDLDPVPVNYSFVDLESFSELVVDWSQMFDVCDLVVSHDNVCFELCGDIEHRTRLAYLCLSQSPLWEKLTSFPASFSQSQFLAFLRKYASDTSARHVLSPLLRNIEWSRAESAKGVVVKGKDSFGKSVEAAIANADSIPDSVELEVSVFQRAFEMETIVNLQIEPRVDEQKFAVWINEDDIVATQWSAMVFAKNRLIECVKRLNSGVFPESIRIIH